MSNPMLAGRRVLVTHADRFMGPVLCDVFERHGAVVIRDTDPLRAPGAVEARLAAAGQIDALVANLAITAPTTAATDVPMAWIYVAMPVGFGLMFVHLLFIARGYIAAGSYVESGEMGADAAASI